MRSIAPPALAIMSVVIFMLPPYYSTLGSNVFSQCSHTSSPP